MCMLYKLIYWRETDRQGGIKIKSTREENLSRHCTKFGEKKHIQTDKIPFSQQVILQ